MNGVRNISAKTITAILVIGLALAPNIAVGSTNATPPSPDTATPPSSAIASIQASDQSAEPRQTRRQSAPSDSPSRSGPKPTPDSSGSAEPTSGPTGGSGNRNSAPYMNDQLVMANLDLSGLPATAQLINRIVTFDQPEQTITQTTSTDNVRYVDQGGAPAVRGNGILLNIGGSGSRAVTTQANFTKPLPVALHAEYISNGQAVDPETLTGTSGTVNIKYTATNTVVEKQTISYKDATGNQQSQTEPVFAPFAGAMQVTLPFGTRLVTAPEASSNTSEDGQTQLLWNLALYPPIGSYQQTVELTISADSIQLPNVLMEVTPITSTQDPATGFSAELLDSSVKGNTELAAGLATLDKSTFQLSQGAAELAVGLSKLSQGTSELASGQAGLASGTGQAEGASGKLTTATKTLTVSLAHLANGLDQLAGTGGLPAAVAGTNELANAVNQIVAKLGSQSDGPIPWPPNPDKITAIQAVRASQKGAVALKQLVDALDQALLANIAAAENIDTDAGTVQNEAQTAVTKIQSAYSSLGCPGSGVPECSILNDAQDAADAAATGAGQLQTDAGTMTNQLELEEAGVSEAISPGLGLLSTVLTKIASGLEEISAALKSESGTDSVYGGLVALRKALVEAAAGAAALATGADIAQAGSGLIAAGQQELTSGLNELTAGADQLATGAAAVNSGTVRLAAGGNELSAGARKLQQQGTTQILNKVVDASKQPALATAYFDAAMKLADTATPYQPPVGSQGRIAYVYNLTTTQSGPTIDWPLVILTLFAAAAIGILTNARIKRKPGSSSETG